MSTIEATTTYSPVTANRKSSGVAIVKSYEFVAAGVSRGTPQLSVIIPVYNGRAFLRESVLSVLAQTEVNLEVIVVDDGSSDGSLESIEDLNVTLLRQVNQGPSAARNLGLRFARAPYVTFLDSDDLMCPESFLPRLRTLDERPDLLAVGSYVASIIDEYDQVYEAFDSLSDFWSDAPRVLTSDFYRRGNYYPINIWLYIYRRETCENLGWFEPGIRYGEDLEFMFRMIGAGAIELEDIASVHRRVHTGNMSLVNREGGGMQLSDACVATARQIYADYGYQLTCLSPWENRFL